MKTRIRQLVTFMVVSIVASATGHAFTLGDLRGSVVLGQPLDVTVGVDVGANEVVSVDCLTAQLLFGDISQPAPNLRVSTQAKGMPPLSLVRIRSTVAVNEPVVTLVLRATCGSITSRSYALLADFPTADLSAIGALPAAQPARVTTPSQKASSPGATDFQQAEVAPGPIAAQASRRAVAAKPKPAKAAPATAIQTQKRPPSVAQVNVAPVTPAAVTEPDSGRLVLKLDSEMVILNPEELAALAALRVDLPKLEPAAEVLKQSLQLETLQSDLKVFKDLTTKNQATLAALQARLGQAEAEQVPMLWLYVLGVLVAAALGALAWVLRQQQSAKQVWWQQGDSDTTETVGLVTQIEPAEPATVSSPVMVAAPPDKPVAPAVSGPQETPSTDLDFDLNQLAGSAVPAPDTSSLDVTQPGLLGITCDLNSETIADLRQQADFFISLGQTPRAINLLIRHILEDTQPHPMVYLDLLTLYHSQGMKAEFRELRLDFGRLFNAVVPDFPSFYQEGKSLLDYPEPLAELVQTWPSGDALGFLEACIFRNDLSAPQVGFDLAAFRDLLLLRALIENVKVSQRNTPFKPFDLSERPTRSADFPTQSTTGVDSNSSVAQATLPAAMPVAKPDQSTPQAAPSTGDFGIDFQIDLPDTKKTPKD